MEEKFGKGWWGSENYKDYYENLGSADDPFSRIKVIPTMSTEVQNATGYDHAGKYECSILMSLYPEAVKLERIDAIRHWFTESARGSNTGIDDKMVKLSLECLKNAIK